MFEAESQVTCMKIERKLQIVMKLVLNESLSELVKYMEN